MTIKRVDFPAAPSGKTGWPWTPHDLSRSSCGPRVTIVTPSYNQAAYLELAMRSVLLQDYADLEYIVIDGGSSDGSKLILDKYANQLAHSVSEPDRGQAHAINKGFARATGEIVAWLNSDDFYLPRAVNRAVSWFAAHPDAGWLYGNCQLLDEATGERSDLPSKSFEFPDALRGASPICQPSVFMRRSLLDQIGLLDESLTFVLDYDLWLRACQHSRALHVPDEFAVVIDHPRAKSRHSYGEFVFESTRVVERFYASPAVPPEAAPFRRRALAHLYAESAASAILTRKSVPQAVVWLLRAVACDPRTLFEVPTMLRKLVQWGMQRH